MDRQLFSFKIFCQILHIFKLIFVDYDKNNILAISQGRMTTLGEQRLLGVENSVAKMGVGGAHSSSGEDHSVAEHRLSRLRKQKATPHSSGSCPLGRSSISMTRLASFQLSLTLSLGITQLRRTSGGWNLTCKTLLLPLRSGPVYAETVDLLSISRDRLCTHGRVQCRPKLEGYVCPL